MRKTKIIATIGPASEKVDILKKMIESGMNVARLNFSHGNYEEHRRRIYNLRQADAETKGLLAIMLDTKGPEIRTGRLKDGTVKLETGQSFILTNRKYQAITRGSVSTSFAPRGETRYYHTVRWIDKSKVQDIHQPIICQVINGGGWEA